MGSPCSMKQKLLRKQPSPVSLRSRQEAPLPASHHSPAGPSVSHPQTLRMPGRDPAHTAPRHPRGSQPGSRACVGFHLAALILSGIHLPFPAMPVPTLGLFPKPKQDMHAFSCLQLNSLAREPACPGSLFNLMH